MLTFDNDRRKIAKGKLENGKLFQWTKQMITIGIDESIYNFKIIEMATFWMVNNEMAICSKKENDNH